MSTSDSSESDPSACSTQGEWYTERISRDGRSWWKKIIPDPYRWHIRSLKLGYMLDVGCGVGRCLGFNDGNGVGVDHNQTSVEQCRKLGLTAYTPAEFDQIDAGLFDSLLLSHVLEHTTPEEAEDLLQHYLPYVRPGGQVVLITPQIAGQRSDPTHVRLMRRSDLAHELDSLGATEIRTRSFPFPEVVGRVFRFNENVARGRIPGGNES